MRLSSTFPFSKPLRSANCEGLVGGDLFLFGELQVGVDWRKTPTTDVDATVVSLKVLYEYCAR